MVIQCPWDFDFLDKLFKSGLKIERVAAKFDRSAASIYNWAARNGYYVSNNPEPHIKKLPVSKCCNYSTKYIKRPICGLVCIQCGQVYEDG